VVSGGQGRRAAGDTPAIAAAVPPRTVAPAAWEEDPAAPLAAVRITRNVRLFVSSSFRDMHEERKQVRLRKLVRVSVMRACACLHAG